MAPKFYTLYKEYPTTELLKILRQSAGYQPEAVAAATQVLSERHVSNEETEQVEQYFRDTEAAEKARQEKIDGYKNTLIDFLEPVLQPTGKMGPNKWLKFVLLLIIIQFAWTLYATISNLWFTYNYDRFHKFDITDYVDFLNLLYIPLFFYLLFKRNRWGWILLFADNLLVAGLEIVMSAVMFGFLLKQGSMHYFPWKQLISPYAVLKEILGIALLFFLWSSPVSDFFNVSETAKKRTVKVVAVLLVLLVITILLLTR